MRLRVGLAATIALICCSCGSGAPNQTSAASAESTSQRAVAERIMKGALTPQPNGVVALAPPDDTASDRATAYVTSQSGKPVAILFVTTKGKGANFSGMLFVDTSIDSLNRRKDSDGIDTVEINAPNPLPPPNDAETCRVRFESTADAGWYRVSCNLD